MKRKKLDIQCIYCGKKYNFEEEVELGNIEETIAGSVLFCKNPKCEMQSIVEKN